MEAVRLHYKLATTGSVEGVGKGSIDSGASGTSKSDYFKASKPPKVDSKGLHETKPRGKF